MAAKVVYRQDSFATFACDETYDTKFSEEVVLNAVIVASCYRSFSTGSCCTSLVVMDRGLPRSNSTASTEYRIQMEVRIVVLYHPLTTDSSGYLWKWKLQDPAHDGHRSGSPWVTVRLKVHAGKASMIYLQAALLSALFENAFDGCHWCH